MSKPSGLWHLRRAVQGDGQSFIENDWLPAISETVRPATHYSYARNLRLHVLPELGGMRLQNVAADDLNRLYSKLLASGSKHYRGGGLSPRSVRYVHTILHRVYRDAMRWGRAKVNPADAADPPRAAADGATPEMKTWTSVQVRAFLQSIEGDPLFAPFLLLATTGLRRGEALGLRWQDLGDRQEDGSFVFTGEARIRQTVICVNHRVEYGRPKTKTGRRAIALDAGTVAALRAHRKRQLETQLLMGPAWEDSDLVFCRNDGKPLHPERFSRDFDKRIARSGLSPIRLHDLRHTWATLALGAGVHPKVVQERLGHASVGITLDIYSHVTPAMQKDAADTVAGLISGR